MPTTATLACSPSVRPVAGTAWAWGLMVVAATLLGQVSFGAPIVLYDSITGATPAGSDLTDSNTWLANQFTTDAATYSLQSVVLDFTTAPAGTIAVDLYSDASGTPGSSLGTFTNPGSFTLGTNTFTASGIPSLVASSAYWVVLRGVAVGTVDWRWTSNSPTGVGASTNTNFSTTAGASWAGLSSGTPYMMTVNATAEAVPEIDPASFGSSISIVLGSLALLDRRRRQG
jgi:hypothetical protein